MNRIVYFEEKLYKNNLVAEGEAAFIHADTAMGSNRNHPDVHVLFPLLHLPGINTILIARPAEPYRTALDFLAKNADGRIYPQDSEARIFLHDLPVSTDLRTDRLADLLKDRKCVIIPQVGVVACGSSPEQAYIHYSAACFAGFVKFFSDLLSASRSGRMDDSMGHALETARKYLFAPPIAGTHLAEGPFETETEVRSAMVEAGEALVSRRLVDSCFGNISYRLENTLYISQGGSFLDALTDAVTACPLSDPDCAGNNPSSEYPAHKRIVEATDWRAILHGHPVFSVIASMDCDMVDCDHDGQCHRDCPHDRHVDGIPIVPGETGAGPYGLFRTVPGMIKAHGGVIVYGHGVFTCGTTDFNAALARMVDIEQKCRDYYFECI